MAFNLRTRLSFLSKEQLYFIADTITDLILNIEYNTVLTLEECQNSNKNVLWNTSHSIDGTDRSPVWVKYHIYRKDYNSTIDSFEYLMRLYTSNDSDKESTLYEIVLEALLDDTN